MLKSLRRIVEDVESSNDFSDGLELLVSRVRETLETQACALFLVDQQKHEYVLMASDGYADHAIQFTRIPFGQGLIGLVGSQEKPLICDHPQQHPHYYSVPYSGEEIYHAFLGVPILHDRRLQGVLVVEQQEPRCYAAEDETFLVTLVSQLGAYIAKQEATEIIAEQISHNDPHDDTVLIGVPGGPGVQFGTAVVIYPGADFSVIPDKEIDNLDEEIAEIKTALELTRQEIRDLSEKLSPQLHENERGIFSAYLRMLDSNSLEKEIIDTIKLGYWSQRALKQVITQRVRQFSNMEDAYLRERAADIQELGQRVLAHLQQSEFNELEYPDDTILIGEELSAADIARVPENKLVAIASGSGSANSHIAILARALNIPAVVGVQHVPYAQIADKELIIDGYYGHVYVTPSPALRRDFKILAEQEKEFDASLDALQDLPAQTTDGQKIDLMINIGLEADVGIALSANMDGVGLFRTEIPFMTRETFPSEEEQRIIYKQVLNAFSPRPVIMRTLDIGGDKTLPYFPIQEENPFLGWRGIRISLDRPDIFLTQVRAMLRANRDLNNLKILLPMISHAAEFAEARSLIQQAHYEVNQEERTVLPPIGAMIEIPSAVYQARLLAKQADFLSIGSNDLTQYILAVDRNNAKVSGIYDAYHPAVLHALQQTARAARLENTPISICGELASDPAATLLLLAMGFDSLSMNTSHLMRVKSVIRRFSSQRSKSILRQIMQYDDPADIRTQLESILVQAGLGGLVRAGR